MNNCSMKIKNIHKLVPVKLLQIRWVCSFVNQLQPKLLFTPQGLVSSLLILNYNNGRNLLPGAKVATVMQTLNFKESFKNTFSPFIFTGSSLDNMSVAFTFHFEITMSPAIKWQCFAVPVIKGNLFLVSHWYKFRGKGRGGSLYSI